MPSLRLVPRPVPLLAALFLAACGDGGSGAESYDVSRPTRARPEATGGTPSTADTRPPLFGGFTAHEALAWGRFRLSWSPAVDNLSPGNQIRYELEGLAPGSNGEPLQLTSGPGATEIVIDANPAYTVWNVRARDEAGNLSDALAPQVVRTRPRLLQVATGAVQGALSRCLRENGGRLVCGGENGRFATWHEGRWQERALPASVEVVPVRNPDGVVELATPAGRYGLDADGQPVTLPQTFDTPPAYPLRRFAYEPSGLAQWLDAAGRVWASNGGPFRPIADPFLLGSNDGCAAVTDLVYAGDRGFARCRSGAQLLLRADGAGYRWSTLADAQALPADVFAHGVVFGEGRQIALLGSDAHVWRYDLGGWSPAYPSRPDQAGARALARTDEARLVWVAADNRVLSLDPLGTTQSVSEPAVLAALVYLEPLAAGGLAVSAWGEVADLARGEVLRPAPPSRFVQVVRQGDAFGGLVAEWPELGLYVRVDQGFTHLPLPALAVADAVRHQVVRVAPDEMLMAVDGGAAGGQILRVTAGRAAPEVLLYPPPPAPPEEGELATAPPAEGSAAPIDPRLLLVGVPPEDLDEPPPPPMPVRALDFDATNGTGVAAGEGGSLWLHIGTGWLRIDPALPVPVPFTAVRITGDHRYLVGGVDGLLLTCEWATCLAEQLDIGDIRAFRAVGAEVWAFGSAGAASLSADGRWARLALELPAPYPSGAAPAALTAAAETAEARWLLGDDGSIWRGGPAGYEAMGLVEAPLDLWVDIDGQVVVATRDALLRFGSGD